MLDLVLWNCLTWFSGLVAGFVARGLFESFPSQLDAARRWELRLQIDQLKSERDMWRDKWKGAQPPQADAVAAEENPYLSAESLWRDFVLSRNHPTA